MVRSVWLAGWAQKACVRLGPCNVSNEAISRGRHKSRSGRSGLRTPDAGIQATNNSQRRSHLSNMHRGVFCCVKQQSGHTRRQSFTTYLSRFVKRIFGNRSQRVQTDINTIKSRTE